MLAADRWQMTDDFHDCDIVRHDYAPTNSSTQINPYGGTNGGQRIWEGWKAQPATPRMSAKQATVMTELP